MNPFFGYWHALSEGMMCCLSIGGMFLLHHYSTRMIKDLWIYKNGEHIEVDFMSAFFNPKSEKMRIINFGYMTESRIYNIHHISY